MSNSAERAREARSLADVYEKKGGHEAVVLMLREHADTLDLGDRGEVDKDAARYRRLAVMENCDWITFNIPSSNPVYELDARNRKPFLDALLDAK